MGKKGTEIKNANSDGIRIQYPENSDQILGEFKSETIKIKLPDQIRFDEIGWLSVWCSEYSEDFGHLVFDDKNVHLTDDNYGSSNVNIDEKQNEIISDGVEIIIGSHLLITFMVYFCQILI